MRNFLKKLKDLKKARKKKKLRQLNLSDETWIRLGEIYSYMLIEKRESVTNEEIIESMIEILHEKVVKRSR